MNNESHKNTCNSGMMQDHVETPPIYLIKSKHNDKSDKDYVKLKLCRDMTSATSDLYELKMALFEKGKIEEFLLFIHNFNMNLKELGMLETAKKVQYIHTIVRG